MRIDLSDTDRQAVLYAMLQLDPPLRPKSARPGYDAPTFDYLDGSWRHDAACKELDTDLFFPEQGASRRRIQAAKNVCRVCPVSTECLDYALGTGSHGGIWGGMVERERQKVRRRRSKERS